MKIKHILLLLSAVLIIAFMEPLVTLVGGLVLLLGVGSVVFRDLPPASQTAVERYLLGWLHRVRTPNRRHNQPILPENKPIPPLIADDAVSMNAAPRVRRTRSKAAQRPEGE